MSDKDYQRSEAKGCYCQELMLMGGPALDNPPSFDGESPAICGECSEVPSWTGDQFPCLLEHPGYAGDW